MTTHVQPGKVNEGKRKLSKFFSRWRPAWERASQKVVTYSVRAVVAGCILLSIIACSLAAVHLALTAGGEPNALVDSISRRALNAIGVYSHSRDEYARQVNSALSTLLVVVTLILAVQPVLISFLNHRKLRLDQPVREFRVFETGIDDIKVMETYYRDADEITIFSGDFDWLTTNAHLREMLLKKNDRLKLVSYRSREEVRQALGELFGSFTFVFQCPIKINCSLVEYPGHKVFLYKSILQEGDKPYNIICAVRGQGNSIYLLEALALLCRHTAAGTS